MWRFPVVIPQAADPMDPDLVQSAIQPFGDGMLDLDEHDLESGGMDNAHGVYPNLIVGRRTGHQFDPGIANAVSLWNIGLVGVQPLANGYGWIGITSTETPASTGGGLVWLTGFVQWGMDPSGVGYLASRVSIGVLIDGQLWLDQESGEPIDQSVSTYVHPIGSIPGNSMLAGAEAIDLLIQLPAGAHIFQLALQARGYAAVFAFNAQLSVIEFRC